MRPVWADHRRVLVKVCRCRVDLLLLSETLNDDKHEIISRDHELSLQQILRLSRDIIDLSKVVPSLCLLWSGIKEMTHCAFKAPLSF